MDLEQVFWNLRKKRSGFCYAWGENKDFSAGGINVQKNHEWCKQPSFSFSFSAISNASWFYIIVILLCFLGLTICFSCKKFRHRLLGLDEQTNELEREAVSEMSSSNELPEDVEPPPSPCSAAGLRSAHRRTCVDRNLDMEMTELSHVPTNPPPTPESDFLD